MSLSWPRKKISRPQTQTLMPDIWLEGFRVYLRAPRAEDWHAWRTARAANKMHLQPFEPEWDEDWTQADYFARRLTRQAREWRDDRSRSFFIFKNDGELIGGMNINNICRGAAQYASLGYWLTKDAEGQGYMAEALRLTLKYCFEEIALHRVHASCLPRNTRSKNLLTKAGFKEEGFAEKYISINGVWEDHILYGMTRENWKKLRAA